MNGKYTGATAIINALVGRCNVETNRLLADTYKCMALGSQRYMNQFGVKALTCNSYMRQCIPAPQFECGGKRCVKVAEGTGNRSIVIHRRAKKCTEFLIRQKNLDE